MYLWLMLNRIRDHNMEEYRRHIVADCIQTAHSARAKRIQSSNVILACWHSHHLSGSLCVCAHVNNDPTIAMSG